MGSKPLQGHTRSKKIPTEVVSRSIRTIDFNNVVGQKNREQILKWFNKDKPKKKLLIIQGRSGNGKTLLPLSLAKNKNYDVQIITPDNVDECTLSTINNSIKNKKLIIFDNFDEFHHTKRNILYDAVNISVYPIVANCTEWKFNPEIFKKSTYMRLHRPRTSEIVTYLKTISNLPESKLYDISLNSDNVLQAIHATITGKPPERTHHALSNNDKLRDLQKQNLNEPITNENIRFLFDSIAGYSDADINTMIAFSYFDYIIHQRHQKVDPVIVNSISSLPKTFFKVRIRKKHNSREHHKKPKKPIKKRQKKKDSKQRNLDKYF
jgi:hypothetical protein